MISKVRPWLILAIIFFAGVLTGIAIAMTQPVHFFRPPFFHDSKNHLLHFLSHRLKLTPDQVAKAEPITVNAESKLRALHHEEIERGTQIFQAMDDQIAQLLTPEQKVELQKLATEREQMLSAHLRARGNPFERKGKDGSEIPPPLDGTPPGDSPPAKP